MAGAQQIASYVLVGLIGAAVGYFAGREHVKYELRTAVQSAVQASFPVAAEKPSAVESGKQAPPPAPKPTQPAPLALTLTSKGFKSANPRNNDYEDDITLVLLVKNLTEKDIRAFDGALIFTDLLDNEIMRIHLAINEPIQADSSVVWEGGIQYNQFFESHKRLRAEAQQNIKTVFMPKKVLFSDGSVNNYDGD